jgi:hypothetical protein
MKYIHTKDEEVQINKGTLLTYAAYGAKSAALCEYVCKYHGITFKAEESESPTGKKIFIFFLTPTTIYKAFRAGSMLEKPELYEEEISSASAISCSQTGSCLDRWKEKFKDAISSPVAIESMPGESHNHPETEHPKAMDIIH